MGKIVQPTWERQIHLAPEISATTKLDLEYKLRSQMNLALPGDILNIMEMSNCIALGVGKGNLEKAAVFYESQMGMRRAQAKSDWIEMLSGPLRLFLVDDDQGTPTFDIQVADVDDAMVQLLASSCEEVMLDGSPKERYIRTPFGHFFCVSSQD